MQANGGKEEEEASKDATAAKVTIVTPITLITLALSLKYFWGSARTNYELYLFVF